MKKIRQSHKQDDCFIALAILNLQVNEKGKKGQVTNDQRWKESQASLAGAR